MSANRSYLLISILLPALMLLSCRHQQAGQSTDDTVAQDEDAKPIAVTVDGWPGVNNLFREGDVYFGGQPDSASFVRFANEEGISTIISLKHPEELERLTFDQPALIKDLGMNFVNIPVSAESMSLEHVNSLSEALEQAGGPVLIHCGSSNRVGAMWASYLLAEHDLTLDEALERGRAAGMRAESLHEAVRRIAAQRE